jgi:hypothetical protein
VFVGIAGSGMRFRSPSAVCDSGSFLRERPLRIGMAVVCGLPGEFNGWICVRFSTVLFTYIKARFVIRTYKHGLWCVWCGTTCDAYGIDTTCDAYGIDTTCDAYGIDTTCDAYGIDTTCDACDVARLVMRVMWHDL